MDLVIVVYNVKYCTICPRSSDPFYIVTYFIKWVTTSWTHYRKMHMGIWEIWTSANRLYFTPCSEFLELYRSPCFCITTQILPNPGHAGNISKLLGFFYYTWCTFISYFKYKMIFVRSTQNVQDWRWNWSQFWHNWINAGSWFYYSYLVPSACPIHGIYIRW